MILIIRIQLHIHIEANPVAILSLTKESNFIPRIGDTINLDEMCYLNEHSLCGVVETVAIHYSKDSELFNISAGKIKVTEDELQIISKESELLGWKFQAN